MPKQYVNLPQDAAQKHGARVFIEVETARLGDAVGLSEWWVEHLGPTPDADLKKFLSARQRWKVSRPNDASRGGKFRNALVLPHVGGEKFKVSCSKKGDRAGAKWSEEYEAWRKIFYTVQWMNAACKTKFDNVKARFTAAFEEAFVELKEKASSQTTVDEPRTFAADAQLSHLYDTRTVLSDRPFHLRIVVLNDIWDVADVRKTWAATRSKVLTHSIAPEELADHTATQWLKSAKAMVVPTPAAPAAPATPATPATWVDVTDKVTKDGVSGFKVDLTTHASLSQAIDAGKSVTVKVVVRKRDHYLGHSLGNFVCVRIAEQGTDAEIEQTILQTFTHEVGHGLQQTVKQERVYEEDGSPASPRFEKNPFWHTDDHGGQGPHCFTNAHEVPAVPTTSTTSHKTYEHEAGKGKLCTMFFRDDDEVSADGKFCENCLPRLKRVDLGELEMKAKGWDRF